MSGQFSDKIVLESLGTKPQVENGHAGGGGATRSTGRNQPQTLNNSFSLSHTHSRFL